MNINELVNAKNNAEVQNVNGWVSSIRDHGGLTFIDLRDFYSSIQIVYEQSKNMPSDIKNEYYISVSGVFKEREKELVNKNKISDGLKNNQHSGATFAYCMRQMQAIANKGFYKWKQDWNKKL